MKTIGILGVHGSREEHANMMEKLGYQTKFLRNSDDFNGIHGIILPGGESTSFGRLVQWSGILEQLKKSIFDQKIPIFGTCAGAILLAKKGSEYSLGAIDIEIDRNAYGRQVDSFSEAIVIQKSDESFHGIFIRAPKITAISPEIEILAEYKDAPVLVKNNTVLACTFHPELTNDTRIHEIFSEMIEG